MARMTGERYIRLFLIAVAAVCSLFVSSNMTEPARVRLHRWIEPNRPALGAPGSAGRPRVAIIIDDFGNRARGISEMFDLKIPLTVAVLPNAENSAELSVDAHRRGFEVLVHLPMEPNHGLESWLGPGAITVCLSDEQIRERVEEAIRRVPFAVGFNNHMGSRVSEDRRAMGIILGVVQAHNMFFVDSRTSEHSIIEEVASRMGVACYRRDVFLDGAKSGESVRQQLKLLADLAESRGYAVGIGHVGVEGGSLTANAIKDMLPYFQQRGIRIVGASQIKKGR